MAATTVFASASCPGSVTLAYVVPTGLVWLVQQVHFSNTAGVAHQVTFYAWPLGSTQAIIANQVVPAGEVFDWYASPGLALPAAGGFGFSSDSAAVTCTVMGTRLAA